LRGGAVRDMGHAEARDMPRAKALRVNVPDRPGMLGEIASALGAKSINVRAVHAYAEKGEGVVCLVVDKLAAASKVLAGRGLKPEEEDVLEVELRHRPGSLGEVATILGEAGVNIRYVFVGPGGAKKATVFLAVSDMQKALKALR
jgi:hypothetical protein